jgi:hypothetical protein
MLQLRALMTLKKYKLRVGLTTARWAVEMSSALSGHQPLTAADIKDGNLNVHQWEGRAKKKSCYLLARIKSFQHQPSPRHTISECRHVPDEAVMTGPICGTAHENLQSS